MALTPCVAERPQAANEKEAYTRASEAAKAGKLDEALWWEELTSSER